MLFIYHLEAKWKKIVMSITKWGFHQKKENKKTNLLAFQSNFGLYRETESNTKKQNIKWVWNSICWYFGPLEWCVRAFRVTI